MKSLSIDLETFSDVDLNKSGVYRYTESPAFEILLFGFARDNDPVTVLDLTAGDTVPEDVLDALTDETVTKWAFNASFERICLSAYLRKYYPERFVTYSIPEDSVRNYLDPASWRCSMIWSAYLGLPLSLKGVGEALDLEEQKMAEGKELLRYFCTPCKPTKANGGRTRNLPSDAPDKWEVFKKYNRRDVEVEMSIKKHLRNFPVPESVWEEYHIDQEINDRGILVDLEMAEQAIAIDSRSRASLTEKLKKLTGLSNPNSVVQMKDWLSAHGLKTDTLGKKAVASLLETAPDDLKEVLKLRQQIAKSSVKKYQAMQNAACRDHRARGMFQFYGANRSGRFSGRLIQLQNLPQNHMPDLAEARALVKNGDYDSLDLLYDSVPNVLSELIRTAFIPRPGMKFIVSDFSSIEARVLAYLSGEQHTMDSFARGEDIYCATASAMFHKPVVKHGINGELRQKGKIAVLACGYGGSVGALKAMGALDMGLQEEELQPIVDAWRAANPHITKFWWDVDRAVKEVIRTKGTREVRGIRFFYKSQMLFIHLPSGRDLAYVKPMIQPNQYGGESITYMGIGSTKKWERIESYGPKIVENITQAISRDILCYAMRTLSHCFICAHVHDELIIECGMDVSVDAVCEQMGRTPPWAPGLLLRADGYECEFYKKD
ncbi:DNA polymerase [Anaerolactibacter massiliensis]|uniref:DNA polymerase n=1 Tax=Anaerolactibacter massiliensis TaxID=2044573 RepID=UPI000CFA5F85|nr:DNA polymerase [Anaerolactibacter massiliensis]